MKQNNCQGEVGMSSSLAAEQISYRQSPSFSLNNISMRFPKQKITSIIGPNGSGKSTFLKVMTNLLKQDNGVVKIDGKEVSTMNSKELARKMTMLSQTHNHDLDFTVRELISHGRIPHRKWYEKLSNKDEEMIDWAISITNLSHLQYQSINQLSGGERQRTWIAMAVVQSPDILLLDEPTTYLDISHQLEIMDLVRYLNRELKMTIIMVLHDINQAAKYSDHLVVMKDGEIVRHGTPNEIINEELFRDIFSIRVKIDREDGVPYFRPIGLVKEKSY